MNNVTNHTTLEEKYYIHMCKSVPQFIRFKTLKIAANSTEIILAHEQQ